jgi:hypothetical protein
MRNRNAAATIKACGLAIACESISSPRLPRLDVRVTIRPAPSEMMNAGTCETRPSPIVRRVKTPRHFIAGQPFSTMPT